MSKTAIVPMAYGTDHSGHNPSPMTSDVVEEAILCGIQHPDAIYLIEGGYHHKDGPTEAELMLEMIPGDPSRIVHSVKENKRTIDVVDDIITMANENHVNHLIFITERFHAWRVWLVFGRLRGETGITIEFVHVATGFGGNSQPCLNHRLLWWARELLAWPYTLVTLHQQST